MVADGPARQAGVRTGDTKLSGQNQDHEPMFNLPPAIPVFIFISVAIFVGQTYYLTGDARFTFIETFCFAPQRYGLLAAGNTLPGGWFAAAWSPFTYVFINPAPSSLIFEMLWLMAFGSAVAFRLGTVRFVAFSAVAALIGAGVFWAIDGGKAGVLFGPDFVVGALLGAAVRFMYRQDLSGLLTSKHGQWDGPALGLIEMWSNVRVLQLFGFIFAANALFSLLYAAGGIDVTDLVVNVLSYFAGMLLLSVFDRHRR
jgi:membrane associated rhomboid family serine protease